MKTAAIIALVGMAAVASAQQTVHVQLTHDDLDGTINVGDTVTWSLTIGFTGFVPDLFFPAPHASGSNMVLNGDNSLGDSGSMTYAPATATDGGLTNGAGIGHVSFTMSTLFGAPPNPAWLDNPYLVGTFSFTATAVGILTYAYGTGPSLADFAQISTGSTSLTGWNLGDAINRVDQDGNPVADKPFTPGLTTGSDTLNIIPSPASAALLGLGGLVAIRRRR